MGSDGVTWRYGGVIWDPMSFPSLQGLKQMLRALMWGFGRPSVPNRDLSRRTASADSLYTCDFSVALCFANRCLNNEQGSATAQKRNRELSNFVGSLIHRFLPEVPLPPHISRDLIHVCLILVQTCDTRRSQGSCGSGLLGPRLRASGPC